MLPVYAQAAAEAFANNCTPYLSDGGRDFVCTRKIEPTRKSEPTRPSTKCCCCGAQVFQRHFYPPELIPERRAPRAELASASRFRASHFLPCTVRALTHRPSDEIARRVGSVHERLGTAERWPGEPRSGVMDIDCCRVPARVLIGLQARTMWADQGVRAQGYRCARPMDAQRLSAANEVHALFMPPDAVRGLTSCEGSPTLTTMVDAAIAAARREFGRAPELSLFVASDSPATREAAVLHAQTQHRIRATHSGGAVRHNNLKAHSKVGVANTSAAAAPTALADLVLLSQADVVVAYSHGSTFPLAAASMARCRQRMQRQHTPRTYYAMLRKLARGLLRQLRNDSYAQSQSEWPASPDCLRECLRLDPAAPRSSTPNETMWPLLTSLPGGTYAALKRMSLACRHSCTCWLQAAFGDWTGPGARY